jgi:hypothetical protein
MTRTIPSRVSDKVWRWLHVVSLAGLGWWAIVWVYVTTSFVRLYLVDAIGFRELLLRPSLLAVPSIMSGVAWHMGRAKRRVSRPGC